MKRFIPLNAVCGTVPVVASKIPVSIYAKRDNTQTGRLKEWLKALCTSIYRNSVYCRACDYETGTNPECSHCVKAKGRGHRHTSVSTKMQLG